ncbi:F-actin-capping protein subunit alpha [Xanthoria calcicola]
MPSDNAAAVSAFIEGAPPGELAEVIADIQKLTVNEPKLLGSVTPAFQKYNEDQLSTVKLHGSGQNVLISPYNALGDGKYYDVETQKSFAFDHQNQKASDVQPYTHDSEYSDLISSLLKSFSTHATEHYPSATYTVCPTTPSPTTTTIALLLVSNKYSPANFWNGRYRSTYLFAPASSTLSGTIHVDVHYYEDGNVRLTTTKKIPEMKLEAGAPSASASSVAAAAEVVRRIAGVERAYQEELNRGFGRLSEGEFKGLRRQLPVTRQKVEWEKIGGYRLGQDIGGGRSR